MAARMLKNITEDYLSCRICLERYTDPCRLPCEHVFCRTCLTGHIAEKLAIHPSSQLFYFTCPLCRTETYAPSNDVHPRDWIDSLPTDNLVEDLLEAVSGHENEAYSKRSQPSKLACERHGGKKLEAYCVTHKEALCWECVGRNHKASTCNCIPAEEAIQNMQPEVMALRQRLRDQVGTAEKLSRSDKDFTNGKRAAMQAIQSLEERLHEFWRSTQAEIKLLKFEVESAYGNCLQERKNFYGLAASLLDTECTFECICESNNPAEIIIALPATEAQADENDKALKALLEEKRSTSIVFESNKQLESFLANFGTVGSVEVHDGSGNKPDSKLGPVKSLLPILERNKAGVSETKSDMLKESQPQRWRCVKQKTEFSARMKNAKTSYVSGITAWEAWLFVTVVNTEGAELKKFDLNGFLCDDVALNGTPHSVIALTPHGTIAITQPDKHIVALMDCRKKLDAQRYITTKKSYNGICQLEGRKVVMSSWSMLCVDILDYVSGQVYRTFDIDPHTKRALFELPDMLCLTSDGDIVISEVHHKLTCISPEGTVKWIHLAPAQIGGICSDLGGNVYICLKDKNIVQRITQDGKVQSAKENFITEADGIFEPKVICDVWRDRLALVTKKGQIHVFDKI